MAGRRGSLVLGSSLGWRGAAGLAALVTGAGSARADVVLVEAAEAAGLVLQHDLQPAYPLGMGWMSGGAAVGDFDRDGFADLFVLSGGGEPDRLFINQGDGTFVDEATLRGLTDLHCGNGVAAGDVDGNGWIDLYVTSFGAPSGPATPGQNRLYLNDGGTFHDVATAMGVETTCVSTTSAFGAAFGDYDLDGRLDLFVAAWNSGGEGNRLFRNGSGGFVDVTAATLGTTALAGVWGFQPALVDMDGDLRPELLVSADFESSRYFRNDAAGAFVEQTAESGTGLDENGMGQAVGDFDNDGRLDWYVTSIHFANPPPNHHNGNTLYRGVGPHAYVESAADAGVDDGGWGWGAVAVDLDHDGWLDIVTVNGREAAGSQWANERAKLFRNQGDGTFVEIAEQAGLDHAASGRCVVWLDAENDGDLDIVITTNSGPLTFYRNDGGASGHWLQVQLDTSQAPRLAPDGFGSRLTATAGELAQVRVVDGSPSFLGTSQPIAHFGLATHAIVDELRIAWTSGQVTVLADVAADQRITVPAPAAADVDADGAVGVDDLLAVIVGWGPCSTGPPCAADVDADGVIDVDDLLAVLLAWELP